MMRYTIVGGAIGMVVGLVMGGLVSGLLVALAGVVIGFLVGKASGAEPFRSAPPSPPSYGGRGGEDDAAPAERRMAITGSEAPPPARDVLRRLDAIDARLARIEARLAGGAPNLADPAAAGEISQARAAPESEATQRIVPPTPAPAVLGVQPEESTSPAPRAVPREAAPEAKRGASDAPPPRPSYSAARGAAPPADRESAIAMSWAWLTGGNALTRIGIVILFFGVAFLLRYFAEIASVPIELKLAGAGAGGLALAALGARLARARPAYGLSLQGAGMGIAYLVVFAGFRLYEVLPTASAIALLVLIAAATIALALRYDSQPLAALALAGGFLAPVLIRTGATDPALLFGYFAVLNAVILALAWRRAWRPLNVLGFVFTFALALVWGHRFYTPSHYAVVQPFLALFFAFYVGIAILHARAGPLDARAPVDGILVFGVPLVGFALQVAIVRVHRYGVAWSAGTLAAVYGALWLLLRGRPEPGLRTIAVSFAALSLVFATLAIPFAADARWTSAWWALEAAAVYWLGLVQRQPLARAFALALQLGAAIAFGWEVRPEEGRLMLNATFLGALVIGLAAIATVGAGDRHRDRIGARERLLLTLVFVWGAAWWTAGGVDELLRRLPHPARIDAALAWVAGTAALALGARSMLRWPRIGWLAALLLPAMVLAAVEDLSTVRTTLTHSGWIVWPLAWIVHWSALRAWDASRGDAAIADSARPARDDLARNAHTLSAIALVAWVSWEASEWTGRYTRDGTVWIACAAALPAVMYLAAVVKWRGASAWPFREHAPAYGASAGTTIAALLSAWFAIVNVVSPGDPSPLPYVPLVNPLDLTLIASLGAMLGWARAWGRVDGRTLYGWLGGAAFLALSAAVVRTAHHWADVPWRLASLMASKPLQAALTLTWTVTALALMLAATRRAVRTPWMVGAVLLAVVVVKLFAIDLAALAGLTRVIAFMGVGLLLLVIGYIAPLPPAASAAAPPADEAIPGR